MLIASLRAEHAASDAVAVRVTLVNASDANLSVLKWNTPLDGVSADLFEVTFSGARVRYIGRMVKRTPPGPTDYLTLAPRQSVSVVVDIGRFYALEGAGDYAVRYRSELLRPLLAGGPHGSAEAGAVLVGAQGAGKVIRLAEPRHPQAPLAQPPTFDQCTPGQVTTLNQVLASAETMALDAMRALATSPEPMRPSAARYMTWFGAYDVSRYATVTGHFQNTYLALSRETISFSCTCSEAFVYAYVHPSQPYVIYPCPQFWSAPLSGTDSQAGTLIHELTHFNVVAGTDDYAYGHTGAQNLALTNPSQAIDNADSHEYFAENTPALFMWVPAHSVYVPAGQRDDVNAW